MSSDDQSSQQFKVILTGELIEGVSKEPALLAFAQLFKLSPEKAAATFAAAPVTLKSSLNAEQSKKFITALTRVGMVSRAQPIGPRAAEISDTKSAASPPAQPSAASAPVATEPTPVEISKSAPSPSSTSIEEPEAPLGLKFKIEAKPDYSFLTVQLPANETLKVEASAMATMDTTIRMKTKAKGGLKRLISGENLFLNEFTARDVPGEVGIAPGTPGDLTHQYLDGNTIFLQNSAYVASTMDVAVETKWQGLTKGFFSGESLFLIRCSGKGDLWFNTYGAIIEIDIDSDYVVDTGNIVAFTEGLEYKISKVGGYKSLFFSGEGFVCRFSGQGKVWIQTRSSGAFASWASYFRPAK